MSSETPISIKTECLESPEPQSTVENFSTEPNILVKEEEELDISDTDCPILLATNDLRCYTCHAEFTSYELLQEHVLKHFTFEVTDEPKKTKRIRKKIQCPYCLLIVKAGESYEAHVNSAHLKLKPYECDLCNKKFATRRYVTLHMRNVHIKNRKYHCQVCSKAFYRSDCLKIHFDLHSEEKRKICGRCFAKSGISQRHLESHSEGSHECPICQKSFARKSYLLTHKNRFHGKYKCICTICKRPFTDETAFNDHMALHQSEKIAPNICPICLTIMKDIYTVRKHLRKTHQLGSEEVEKLGYGTKKTTTIATVATCDAKFTSNESLQEHFTFEVTEPRKTPTTRKKIQCQYCSLMVQSNESYEAHVNTVHLKIKPYECDLCNKKFATKGTVTPHMKNVHMGIRNYECHECFQAFFRSNDLKKHLELHSEESHECPICRKSFARKFYVTRHIQFKHERTMKPREKAFCEICEKFFRNKSSYTKHQRLFHGKYKFICTICKKPFTNEIALNNHMTFHQSEKMAPNMCPICFTFMRDIYAVRIHLRNVHQLGSEEVQKLGYGTKKTTTIATVATS